MIKRMLFGAPLQSTVSSMALLLLRVGFGGMMAANHGYPKLQSFNEMAATFPDPLALGSATSAVLAISAEFFCSILLVVGLMTRACLIPLIITMLVAFFLVHGADPFAKRELAGAYALAFIAIGLMGPGRFSLDARIAR